MRTTPSVVTLEIMECGLTSLSCEFIGRMLSPELNNPLLVLKLDHNDLGNDGILNLSRGLCMNSVLKTLALSYCNFDHNASRSIMQILIFQESALQEIDLQGNRLENEGSCKILHGLKVNQCLNKLNLADNGINGDDSFIDKLVEMLTANTSLLAVDFRLNLIFNEAVEDILDRMKNAATGRINQTCYEIIFPDDKVKLDTIEELNKFLLPNKKSKKGKKKGKKAKK